MYSFPLTKANFFDKIFAEECTFEPPSLQVHSTTRSGEIIAADTGGALWRGTVKLQPDMNRDNAALMAMVNLLRPAGRMFQVYDKAFNGPRMDPTGSILGASTPTIHTLDASFRAIRLQGLPSTYQLRVGDMISWAYSSGRQALHQVVESATAVAGVTPLFEIYPPYRTGVTVATAVQLLKPYCNALIVPNTINPGSRGGPFTGGAEFAWVQTIRVP